jgi:selT/selW/selH-like putative selenoprotein
MHQISTTPISTNIKITYCTECHYAPLAQKLAEAIKQKFGLAAQLEAGHGGIYQISLEGQVIYNNLEQGGRLPTTEEILQAIQEQHVAPEKTSNGGQPISRQQRELMTVLNPMGYPPQIQPVSMAPRLDTLDGKTIYLVDARFDDSDRFLAQMQHWFAEHMPRTQTRLVSKSGVYTEDDPDLFAEIKAQGDAMIMGVGH